MPAWMRLAPVAVVLLLAAFVVYKLSQSPHPYLQRCWMLEQQNEQVRTYGHALDFPGIKTITQVQPGTNCDPRP